MGNGGIQADLYEKFGYNSKIYVPLSPFASKNEIMRSCDIESDGRYNTKGTIKELNRKMQSPDFFEKHHVELGIEGHAYTLTKEKDDNNNVVYYLFDPVNHGFPAKYDNFDYVINKASLINVVELE